MGLDSIVITCHEIEELLINCDKQCEELLGSLDHLYSLLSSFSKGGGEYRPFVSSVELSNFAQDKFKSLDFRFNLERAHLETRDFLALRKILTELVKNSYAHSKDCQYVNVDGVLAADTYSLSYYDDGFVEMETFTELSVFNGRGVGLVSLLNYASERGITLKCDKAYNYKIILKLPPVSSSPKV